VCSGGRLALGGYVAALVWKLRDALGDVQTPAPAAPGATNGGIIGSSIGGSGSNGSGARSSSGIGLTSPSALGPEELRAAAACADVARLLEKAYQVGY